MLSSKCHERGQKANEKAKSRYLCDARADFIYINIGKIIALSQSPIVYFNNRILRMCEVVSSI